jgi:hypothetical protein
MYVLMSRVFDQASHCYVIICRSCRLTRKVQHDGYRHSLAHHSHPNMKCKSFSGPGIGSPAVLRQDLECRQETLLTLLDQPHRWILWSQPTDRILDHPVAHLAQPLTPLYRVEYPSIVSYGVGMPALRDSHSTRIILSLFDPPRPA